MTKGFIAVLDGQITGRIVRDARGKISFTYEDDRRNAEDTYPPDRLDVVLGSAVREIEF